jgi:hypothetical protein
MHRQRAWKTLSLEVLPSCKESTIGILGVLGKCLQWATVSPHGWPGMIRLD